MNPSYKERLTDYINQKEKILFTVMLFSSVEKSRQYGEEHMIKTLLTNEGAREPIRDVKAKQVMTSCQGELMEEREEFPIICKYQSGDCVMREVMARYYGQPMELTLAFLGSRTVVIGIYSSVGRCLGSSLTPITCQQMARQEVILYMNLEEYSGFSRLVYGDYRADLSDVLYLYRQGICSWICLKPMVYNWGSMGYIPPVRYGESLSQVTPEEVAMLIDRIARESGHDEVVVDVGQMGREALLVLSVCNIIYMPAREGHVLAAKIEESEECLEAVDDGLVRERIRELKLPRMRGVVQREEYLERLLFGELRNFVRRLLTE